jgi:exopolysaccharide biosynthesis polyprenyl glycosylphosphotransferase
VTGALLTTLILFFGAARTAPFARWTLVISTLLIFVFLTLWRWLFLRFGSVSLPAQRILILGTGEMALNLANNFEKYGDRHLSIVGFVGMEEIPPLDIEAHNASLQQYAPLKSTYHQLPEIITDTQATRLIVATPSHARNIVETIALIAGSDVSIDVVPDVYEILFSQTDSIVGDIPLIHASGRHLSSYGRVPKRAFDLFLSLILAIITAPIMLLAALAIKLDDGGPVLYRQERVGKDGRIFNVLKFRTMRIDAEQESGPVLADEDDERITRVGRLIRTFRIDELPQVLNVVRGQMSFIGPRPERPFFVRQFSREIEGYDERLRVLPGITGLAQINGGYATTPQLKLKYDLMYVYHQSFLLDLQVMAETVKVVLTGRGAR